MAKIYTRKIHTHIQSYSTNIRTVFVNVYHVIYKVQSTAQIIYNIRIIVCCISFAYEFSVC